MTNQKSKIFFTLLVFLFFVSISLTYYKYVVLEDFEIFTDEETFNQELVTE
mgnify:CR=1|jgi:hypothetical protein